MICIYNIAPLTAFSLDERQDNCYTTPTSVSKRRRKKSPDVAVWIDPSDKQDKQGEGRENIPSILLPKKVFPIRVEQQIWNTKRGILGTPPSPPNSAVV